MTKQFDYFDEYEIQGHNSVIETMIRNDKQLCFLESTCTCEEFRSIFICKHILGFVLQLKIRNCPKEGCATPIAPKKKRGRTTHAKKALEKQ